MLVGVQQALRSKRSLFVESGGSVERVKHAEQTA